MFEGNSLTSMCTISLVFYIQTKINFAKVDCARNKVCTYTDLFAIYFHEKRCFTRVDLFT